jgi:ComF family protein
LCAEQLHGAESQHCGACLRRTPRFDSTHCAYRYGYPVDHLVRALKYRDRLAYARVLGELLAQSLSTQRFDPWPQCVIPIPLAAARFRERGFNQAMEIGKQLVRRLKLPLSADALVRRRETREQAGLDRDERRRNVRGAFALLKAPQAGHVAILDDVVTTGSTANEVARVLKRAKVERIEVWAVARASK